jgi:hypothetical protein
VIDDFLYVYSEDALVIIDWAVVVDLFGGTRKKTAENTGGIRGNKHTCAYK